MKYLLIVAFCLLIGSKAKHFLVELDSSLEDKLSKVYAKNPTNDDDNKINENIRDGDDYGLEIPGNNDEVFEGDMILSKEQMEFMASHVLKKGQRKGEGRNAIIGKKYRWPKNTLTYRFDPKFTNEQKLLVKRALEKLQLNLTNCICFEEYSSGIRHIVLVKNVESNGCNANVGYHYNGLTLNQHMNLGFGCFKTGKIQHEFLHALGIWHAQSRSDRDKYVKIKLENVDEGNKHNFERYDPSAVTHYDLPYDFESVMHYDGKAFSKNGKLTIRTLDPTKQRLIYHQKPGVSKGDVQLLKKLYRC